MTDRDTYTVTGDEPEGWYRLQANMAAADYLTEHPSIRAADAWPVVDAALDAFEDEIARQSKWRMAYVVMLGVHPMLVVGTKRIAREQMRIMRRMAEHPAGHWHILRTQVALPDD